MTDTEGCRKECAKHCPHQDHRKESCPLRKEDFECHTHSAVIHRLEAGEEAMKEIEARDTERKMILHRLETAEKEIDENEQRHKDDLKALDEKYREKMKTMDEKNETEHIEFRKFMVKVMVILAASTNGISWVMQYLLF